MQTSAWYALWMPIWSYWQVDYILLREAYIANNRTDMYTSGTSGDSDTLCNRTSHTRQWVMLKTSPPLPHAHHTHTCTHTCIQTCTCTHTHTHTCTCTHTHTHTCMYTHTCTHIHTPYYRHGSTLQDRFPPSQKQILRLEPTEIIPHPLAFVVTNYKWRTLLKLTVIDKHF